MVKGYIEGQCGNMGGRIAVSRKHYIYCDMFYLLLLSVFTIASGLLIVVKFRHIEMCEVVFYLLEHACVCGQWGRCEILTNGII